MNITKENTDELNALLTIELEKSDYEENVANVLKDYKKKARIDGFRPGKVPMGLINKMYRKQVLVDEVNKLVTDSLYKYISEEKLNVLGDPLPNEEKAPEIDWEEETGFKFVFDLGLAPELDITINGKDKIPSYQIEVDDDMINKYVDHYTQQFGKMEDCEVSDEKSVIRANIRQLVSEGNVMEEGIAVDDCAMSIEIIKDDAIKAQMVGLKENDTVKIDLRKAYPNDTELSQLLQIDKEKAAEVTGEFEITILKITTFVKAELDQDLFDRAFGEDNIKSEEEFRAKISEEASKALVRDSEFRFKIDAKEKMVAKFKADLPEEFLKRWVLAANKGKFTKEQIDEDFPKFAEDLKWQLIKDHIAKSQEIELTEEDIKQGAADEARRMFAQYGMANVPDEQLAGFADTILKKDEDRKRIIETKYEDKIVDYIKSVAKVEEKSISLDKFNKLFDEKK